MKKMNMGLTLAVFTVILTFIGSTNKAFIGHMGQGLLVMFWIYYPPLILVGIYHILSHRKVIYSFKNDLWVMGALANILLLISPVSLLRDDFGLGWLLLFTVTVIDMVILFTKKK
ncbi:hypothetical protein J7287_001482 [Vibrio parahaemolyticus]|uniref:hypothetical protein n=1 Tax=Vibrio parahaemolyticus TaxID=670 RepID=UPI0013762D9F|nr:hypothetical protein [Vibrio parahaemolyticus]EHH3645314.1 hypothetical protein [Vibrio parahaemolyticus]EHH3734335.1 hypothetical protein [Vibrio parahaemolyticus]MBM5257510.1 hypothetical protein [Vibrio parahaemolyticus]MBM5274760.1 hypothetical protein [Vibrio parahaemolyticus]MCF9022571.1 hypothetical protein [Vibrio parahaemolyticus]